MRNAYNILVRKPERKKALERPRRIWKDDDVDDDHVDGVRLRI
jgi:hypothetical protein